MLSAAHVHTLSIARISRADSGADVLAHAQGGNPLRTFGQPDRLRFRQYASGNEPGLDDACLAMAWPAPVKEVQSLRAASANQPSFPAYVKALTNWLPSNPISEAFFSIHAFALGAWVSIPAATNVFSSRIASARSI